MLLDSWATWHGPCLSETPHLKAVHDTLGKDARFIIISLSLDNDLEAPKKYVEENDLKWVHGFLGEWSKTPVPNQYAVRGIPAIILIGPDGKILDKDLRGSEIAKAVTTSLGE